MGHGHAIGSYSFAKGAYGVEAHAFSSFTIGQFNEGRHNASNPHAKISWLGDDENSVFEVGIGTSTNNRKNALTVLQDGSVEIGKDSTDGSIPLHVKADGSVVLAKPQGDISMGIYQ
jgi:hypothetical protein